MSRESADELHEEQVLALQVCLRETIGRSQRELNDRLPPRESLPHLHRDQFQAFDARMAAVTRERAEKVNADSRFRRMMKARFPSFRSNRGSERLVFHRPLTERLHFAISFDKVRQWGLGKSFHVLVGLLDGFQEGRYAWPIVEEDLMAVYGEWRPPNVAHTWAYASVAELDIALNGVAQVLEAALPVLEKGLLALVDPLPTAIPPQIGANARLHSHQAIESARRLAQAWNPAGGLIALRVSDDQPLRVRTAIGARTWQVVFRAERSSLVVELPERGPTRWFTQRHVECWPDEWLEARHIPGERAIEIAVAARRESDNYPADLVSLQFEDRRFPTAPLDRRLQRTRRIRGFEDHSRRANWERGLN